MEEQEIRQRIRAALGEVTAPTELVERMSKRAAAIVRGREAEKQLAAEPEAPADQDLLANAVVGRLMLTEDMPRGMDGTKLAASLMRNERFCQAAKEKNAVLLSDLQTGRLICRLGMKPQEQPEKQEPKPQLRKDLPGLSR